MSLLNKIESIIQNFSQENRKVHRRKSGIVWGTLKDSKGITPLFFISKPKMVSQEDFEDILSKLQITILK